MRDHQYCDKLELSRRWKEPRLQKVVLEMIDFMTGSLFGIRVDGNPIA
jgi:hypothetical protein